MEIGPNEAQAAYLAHREVVQGHLQALDEIVRRSLGGDPSTFEGNAFYRHQSFDIDDNLIPKQVQLFALGGLAPNHICEIGFNAGHSMLLFLLGRRWRLAEKGVSDSGKGDSAGVDCVVFDINEHAYTMPAFEYLRTAFPEARFKFLEGDSTEEAPAYVACRARELGTFDLVHVDGGHEEPCIRSDLACAQKLVRAGGYVVIDDTDDPVIDYYVDTCLRGEMRRYEEVRLYDALPMYPHRILKRIGA